MRIHLKRLKYFILIKLPNFWIALKQKNFNSKFRQLERDCKQINQNI